MRQFLFTGFNGFEQFCGSDNDNDIECVASSSKVNNTFKAVVNANVVDTEKMLIAPSWRYTAFAIDRTLWLRGLLTNAPGEVNTVQASARIQSLAACDKYCLALLENGELYKLIPEVNAQLEPITLERSAQPLLPQKRSIFGVPTTQKKEDDIRITHIACGAHIAAAISKTNAIYSIPSLMHQLERHIRVQQLVCGFEHALLLNTNGDVYTWGNGLRGQLGHSELRLEEMPTLLEALAGVKIISVAAGGWHSAAISAFGDLYTWGFNVNGQLGLRVFKPNTDLKEPTVYPLPQVVDLPNCCIGSDTQDNSKNDYMSCSALRVFAGARHTLLQMNCNRILAVGWNAHGQLGLSKNQFYDTFQSIDVNSFRDVICGPWCTVLLK